MGDALSQTKAASSMLFHHFRIDFNAKQACFLLQGGDYVKVTRLNSGGALPLAHVHAWR